MIKSKLFSGIGVFIVSFFAFACSLQIQTINPREIETKELLFSPKKVDQWQDPSGARVFFLKDSEIPIVSGSIYFPGGSLYNNLGKEGTGAALSFVMRNGGGRKFSFEEIEKTLNRLGASIEISIRDDYTSVYFNALKEDFPKIFEILSDILWHPAMPRENLDFWKYKARAGIIRRMDEPGVIAQNAFLKYLYGQSVPHGRVSSLESVNAISIISLREMHEKIFRPQRSRLGITGDISRSNFEKLCRKFFDNNNNNKESKITAELPKPKFSHIPGIYVLEKELDQTTVVLGHAGAILGHVSAPRDGDDYFPLLVFNQLFGTGAFISRLFEEVRSKRGLVYGISGGFSIAYGRGVFRVLFSSKNNSVIEALSTTLELIEDAAIKPPKENEVDRAILALKRTFVFEFVEPFQRATRATKLDLFEYPKNFDDTFIENLSNIKVQEVARAARTWLRPEELTIILVGGVDISDVVEAFGDEFPVYKMSFANGDVSKIELQN